MTVEQQHQNGRKRKRESPPNLAIGDVSPVLRKALEDHKEIFDSTELTGAPVAQFYDLDLYDDHLRHCREAFGPTVDHFVAIKSCPLSKMVRHAYDEHGFGIETASIGEVLHALENCRIPPDKIVFDSPCKTRKELEFAIRQRIHCNFDNFEEFNRAKSFIKANTGMPLGNLGFRINPLVGAGSIAALSVSTSEGKFGVPITERAKLLEAYAENPWMNSGHVHVGSGGMGASILTAGIRTLVNFAKEVNANRKQRGDDKPQITVLDIGGGLPANYTNDEFRAEKVPIFSEYAEHLKRHVPELFSGKFKVMTEFGQATNAKVGFLASRVEWLKGTAEHPMAIIHFGADCCPRQAYTEDHKRRVEAYNGRDGSRYALSELKNTSVGGPLCFQGDFVARGIKLPAQLVAGDFIVMKDCGANTLSMFSRHCSRLCPPVYGYRWTSDDKTEVKELVELKPRETMRDLSNFWGEYSPVVEQQ